MKQVMPMKWRPALWMVVGAAFMVVALLPVAGLLIFMGVEQFLDQQFALRSVAGLALLALGSLITASVVGVVFLRTLLHPIQQLERRTREIEAGSGDAFRAFERGGTREIATVSKRFIALAKRLSDRSDYLTLFTTHLSHEFKTPLSSISGATELLLDEGTQMEPSQRRKFLKNIAADADRLSRLSTRLRELARAEAGNVGGAGDAVQVLRREARSESLTVNAAGSSTAEVAMSEDNLTIFWQQFIRNALECGADEISISSRLVDQRFVFNIGDNGNPISKVNKNEIFDAFFTTRRASGGTGMGLGIARTLAVSHGGSLGLSGNENYKFQFIIPAAQNSFSELPS